MRDRRSFKVRWLRIRPCADTLTVTPRYKWSIEIEIVAHWELGIGNGELGQRWPKDSDDDSDSLLHPIFAQLRKRRLVRISVDLYV